MRKNMKYELELNYLLIPFSQKFDDLLQDIIWTPLGPQSHVFQMGTILGNVSPPPLSSPQVEVGHELHSSTIMFG
jgi:hypothetical protein